MEDNGQAYPSLAILFFARKCYSMGIGGGMRTDTAIKQVLPATVLTILVICLVSGFYNPDFEGLFIHLAKVILRGIGMVIDALASIAH